ncbi:hypothetical protein BCV72DRAFT_219286 [Rhizopus microsporus var. microsporus]|uniref:Uncharacterized protein n=1 Tax=Rhizopus microsporus var. microsporus TaxID=86635 RepID=A0A1X0RI07_RHIZD|nr:hypothetical protein BCV72DRAFT_219286 [Rhizopus microsporus var. microsporus]
MHSRITLLWSSWRIHEATGLSPFLKDTIRILFALSGPVLSLYEHESPVVLQQRPHSGTS